MVLGGITKYIIVSAFLAVLTSCASDPLKIAETRAPSGSEASEERQVFQLINQYRQRNGKERLAKSDGLQLLARSHSQDMASGKRDFGHDGIGFRSSYSTNLYRMDAMGEVVGYSTRSDAVQWIFNQWLESGGHNKQLLDDADHGGAGIATSANGRTYITFSMATKRKSSNRRPNAPLDRQGNPL